MKVQLPHQVALAGRFDALPGAAAVFAVIESTGALRTLVLTDHPPHTPAECRVSSIDDEETLAALVAHAESSPGAVCRTRLGGAESINSPDVWAPRALRALRRAP